MKILLWDIDGTVLNFLAAEKAAIRKGFADRKMGECTDEMLAQYSAINKKYWEMLERGEMTKPEILVGRFREFFEKCGIDTTLADGFNAQYQLDLGDTICFNDHAYELICDLKAAGFRQYAVSNGTKTAQRKKLHLSGLEDVFDGIFISDEVGVEKPNKEFFDIAFAKMGTELPPEEMNPDNIMIIGDSLTSDIAGGNNAGIRTCWYNPGKNAKPESAKVDFEISDLNELKEIMK